MALSISLLDRLCFTVFTVPSFGILGDFPSFHLLGFWGIFHHSAVPRFRLLGFGIIFCQSAIPRFRLLGFGVIFRRSTFRHSVPSFQLLGLPLHNHNKAQIPPKAQTQMAFTNVQGTARTGICNFNFKSPCLQHMVHKVSSWVNLCRLH